MPLLEQKNMDPVIHKAGAALASLATSPRVDPRNAELNAHCTISMDQEPVTADKNHVFQDLVRLMARLQLDALH